MPQGKHAPLYYLFFAHLVNFLLETVAKLMILYVMLKNFIVDSSKVQIIGLGSKSVRNSKFDT